MVGSANDKKLNTNNIFLTVKLQYLCREWNIMPQQKQIE